MTDERLGHPVRQPRRRPVAVRGEHEGVVGELDVVRWAAGFGPAPVFDQPFDRGLVDRHAIGAMRLGGPQHRTGRSFDVGAREADGGVADVDLGPAQPEQLAAPSSGRGGQPQVGGEVRIAFLDVGEQPLHLIR